MKPGLLLSIIAIIAASHISRAQNAPLLLKDINTQPAAFGSYNMDPAGFCQLDGITYYTGYTANAGRQLWRTDGTSSGTRALSNNPNLSWQINAASVSEIPSSLTAMNGGLYFFTANKVAGLNNTFNLMRADTSGNTNRLATSSGPFSAPLTTNMLIQSTPGAGDAARKRLLVFNNNMYFAFSDQAHGIELWKSDGTAAGTAMLKDLTVDATSSSPMNFTVVGNTLFFTASTTGNNYTALWKTDGTVNGTVKVKDSVAESNAVRFFNVINNKLYFMGADNSNFKINLWQSDGTTAGTIAVATATTSFNWIRTQLMKQGNNAIYTFGNGLMKYDGTSSTLLASNVAPQNTSGRANQWTEINGTLYFSATNNTTSTIGLWKTDGTVSGTTLVYDQITTANYFNGAGTLYFAGNDNAGEGMELWKSNGTTAGTTRLSSFNTNASQSNGDGIVDLTAEYAMVYQSGKVLLSAYNGLNTGNVTNSMVAASDGTVAGTGFVQPALMPTYGSFPGERFVWNNNLYFSAYTPANGDELWKTDGTPAGTLFIKDLDPGTPSSHIQSFTPYNGSLYFLTSDSSNGYLRDALWKTDGTTAGTIKIKDSLGHEYYGNCKLGVSGSVLFVTAGGSVYISDGTTAGTINVPIKFTGAPVESIALNFAFLGNTAVVAAASNVNVFGANELWNINLITKAATRYATGFVYYPELVTFDGAVYCTKAQTSSTTSNWVLWKTDGTAANTTIVDLAINPHNFTVMNNGADLYYITTDATSTLSTINRIQAGNGSPQEVTHWNDAKTSSYFYDNTFSYYWFTHPQITTTYLQSLYPNSAYPYFMKAASTGTIFMPAGDASTGIELFTTDGTAIGTTMVKNINPDSVSSNPQFMTRVVNKQGDTIIAFVANDDARGPEIWLSNGTANGTINYASTLPYSNSLNPKYLTLLNNKIIFWGNSVEYGMEPYAFEMQQVLKVVAPQSTAGSFYIYPNPADKLINIHSAAGSNIQIYNVAGVKMLETTATTENTVLPVSGFLPGFYTISITSKDGTSTAKFIKQ